MTGWRVGYAVAHEPFMTGMRKLVLYSVNGVSTMTQWAALEALRIPRSEIDARREQYRQRRDLLVNGLNEMDLPCEMPQGAFYAFPRVTKISKDSRVAARMLLSKALVATVPGVVFGGQGEGHVRFSYAIDPQAIEEGLAALKKYLVP
jgi:aspartate aminotransferase